MVDNNSLQDISDLFLTIFRMNLMNCVSDEDPPRLYLTPLIIIGS